VRKIFPFFYVYGIGRNGNLSDSLTIF